MNLLWICGAKARGGAENTTLQILGLLRARGFRIEVLCPDGALRSAAQARGFAVQVAALGGALNLRSARAVFGALRGSAPDAALVTTADEWVWACLGKPARSPTRLVLVRYMMLPLARRVQRLASWRADTVVAAGDAVRRSLTCVRADKVRVIRVPYHFPPRADVPQADERLQARRVLGLPESGALVAFFGGLSRAKGIDDVLTAVAYANSRVGETHLAVCGPALGPGDARALGARSDRDGLRGRVHCLGTVDRVDRVMTGADAVVLATRSELGEALPLSLLEAMACGTPVCGYAVGGVPEAIGADGETGRLARPDDSVDLGRVLVEVLADPGSSRRSARRALERMRREFDPEEAADSYQRLLTPAAAPTA